METDSILADPVGYWDTRHGSVDEWRSGGDRGVNVYRNRALYAHRLGLLVSILDRHHLRNELRVLDAGCGKGWLTDQLSAQGHEVVGVDSSPRAIEICRTHRAGEFHVGTLDGFRTTLPFDAVICMDVLFHILDEETWRRSVLNLASLLAMHGLLILSEIPADIRLQMGNYILHRPLEDYDRLLQPLGIRRVDTVPYAFSGNPNAFIVYKKSL